MTDIEALGKFSNTRRIKLTWKRVFDGVATVSILLFVGLDEFGWLPELVHNGYYCDDRTIQRPFKGDTISGWAVAISGLMPFLFIWLTEALFYVPSSEASVKQVESSGRLLDSMWQAALWFRKYFRALLIKIVLIDALKVFTGEHRPHFIDTCRPNVECSGSEYISSFHCTNPELHFTDFRDASKSFPSGHASVSVYSAVFMIWYLQRRVPKVASGMVLLLIQFIFGLWAIFCSLSRVSDDRHHWWDVLAGFVIGLVTAVLTCVFSCHDFCRLKHKRNNCGPYHNKDHEIKLIEGTFIPRDDSILRQTMIHAT